ncbi:MAG: fimbrillin family protein [Alistipes sp.]|nr:fimbrillin family protein [Alistipes sp.]
MKKNNLKTIAALALAAAVIAGCSKEQADGTDGPVAVNFSAGIGETATPASTPISRASDTSWGADDPVGVYMLGNGTSTVLAGNKNYEVTNTLAGTLTPATGSELCYPQDGSAVDFVAYYPWGGGITGTSYSIDVSDQGDLPLLDLMWAKATGTAGAGYSKTNPTVALEFEHKLTKLIIKTQAAPGVGNMAGMDVTIQGMDTEATFDLMAGTLGSTSTPLNITPATAIDGQRYEAIILPCTVTNAGDVTVWFEVGTEPYVWTIPAGTVFDGGEEHTWTVTLTGTGVTATGTIKAWTPKTHPDQTAE